MFLISIVKRCIAFVNWKRKAPLEEFDPKRYLSCNFAGYISSVVTGTPSRQYYFDYCCYPTNVYRTYIKYV